MKKKLLLAMTMSSYVLLAGVTNTVKVTKFHQSYPYSGKATVEYTVGGTLPENTFAEIILNTDDASATFVQSNIVTGANTFTIDFASSFGGALLLTNASFVVTIAEGAGGGSSGGLGGVQLWENGPYWAECNVGATRPEEYGYYFWWGDTVGYNRSGGTWTEGYDEDCYYYYSGVTWVSSTGEQMSNSPFSSSSCPTYGKDYSALQSAGYIDSTGNLAPEHDAAHVHWGGAWRMPTDAEFSALIDNCTFTLITSNGVPGRLVTGKGDYANRSIFLPAAGGGNGSNLDCPGSDGVYWSSTPHSDTSFEAWFLNFDLSDFERDCDDHREAGQSIRPLRSEGGGATMYAVTYSPGANGSGAQQTATKTHDVALTLKGATFTRSGYTQTGWSTSDGGAKAYDLGAAYTSNAAVTLYPYWTADPGPDTHGGVQLWENGPYWAECNVGATRPEEYGYYFWWGDTVGYTNTESGWISVKDGTSFAFADSGTAASTYTKYYSALLSAGYIDSTGNLVAAHDAATAHLGAPWRMPTSEEIEALVNNCTTTWITTNGVNGRLVTGKGDYANRSIFLPAAGYGHVSYLYHTGSRGYYWSSAPNSDISSSAWYLIFSSSDFYRYIYGRYFGLSVRPVRGFAE